MGLPSPAPQRVAGAERPERHYRGPWGIPPVAVAGLCPACAACPLIRRSLGDPGDAEGGHTGHSVVMPLLDLPTVHHILDARDGEGRLGHIGGHYTQPSPLGGRLEDLGGWQRQQMNHQNQERIRVGPGPEFSHRSEASGLPGRGGEQASPLPPALITQQTAWVIWGLLCPHPDARRRLPPAPARPSLPAPASPGPAGSRVAAHAGGATRPAAHLGEAEACWYPNVHGRSQPQAASLPGLLCASHTAKGSALGTSTVGREVKPGWTEGWGPRGSPWPCCLVHTGMPECLAHGRISSSGRAW